MTVFGTRPEIIRLSETIKKLDEIYEENHIIINTHQNTNIKLNEIFIDQLRIKAKYNLNIHTSSLAEELADLFLQLYPIMLKEKPDKLLILGDTNSGLSAILAREVKCKIYHMEAGMRSNDWNMPEERNRRIIDHISNINLPYTELSRQNLLGEGIDKKSIFVTGNPIKEIIEEHKMEIDESKILEQLNIEEDQYFVATIHRKENVDEKQKLKSLLQSLKKVHDYYNYPIILLTHSRTLDKLDKFKLKIPNGIIPTIPIGFIEMHKLLKTALCVLTDSGTIPEECLYWKVPSVTLRDSTERPEVIEAGATILAGIQPNNVLEAVHRMMNQSINFYWNENIFGDSFVSDKVVNIILNS